VRRHIANLPEWRDRLQLSFGRGQRTQYIYQFFIHPAEKVGAQDGLEAIGLICHVSFSK